MKKYIIAAILIGIGVIISFPLFSISYYTMVRTSTPQFCGSCHEIKPAVVAWRSSTHTNNAAGVVVDCMDCHLPPPQDTFNFFFAKTTHGLKDVVAHFIGEEYDRQKARESVYDSFDNVLLIKFDSGAHGTELEGLLKREIFITSNDPASPEVIIEFTANVTK